MPDAFKSEQIDLSNAGRWDNLLMHSLYPSYRQSLAFEYSRQHWGRKVFTYIFSKGGSDFAGVNYSVAGSALNLISSADILSGILFRNEPEPAQLSFIIEHFNDFAKSIRADVIRIKTWMPDLIGGGATIYGNLLKEVLIRNGFKESERGRDTYWIDLGKREEEILSDMKRQTRYDIKQGLKSAIQTEVYDTPDESLINSFWLQYRSVAETKGFNSYNESKFKTEIKMLMNAGLAYLFTETCHEKVVNYSVASNFGIASYLHGALVSSYRHQSDCPPPGALAQWKMITEMKARGASFYDLGFCPGAFPVPGHPSYNIWRFKYGFGGVHVKFTDNYLKFLRPVKGRLFKLLKSV